MQVTAHTQERFWHEQRLTRLALAIALGLMAALFLVYWTDESRQSLLKTGDFPGFYAPAVIIERGLNARLYDPALQREIQNEFWPAFKGQYYMSVYPPIVGLALAPLARLPLWAARGVFTVASLALFAAAVCLLASFNQFIRRNLFSSLLFLLLLAPVFYGVLGGQAAALSAFLFVAGIWCLKQAKDHYRRARLWEIGAGILWGLWFFKPQFAVFMVFFAILGRRFFVLAGQLAAGLIIYLCSVQVLGFQWLRLWLSALSDFSAQNYLMNRHQQVSIIGSLEALRHSVEAAGVCSFSLTAAGIAFSLLVLFLTVKRFLRQPGPAPYEIFFLAGPAIMLLSPQTLFYDLTIALMAAARYAELKADKTVWGVFFLIAVLAALTLGRQYFAFPPLCLVNLLVFVWVYRHSNSSG